MPRGHRPCTLASTDDSGPPAWEVIQSSGAEPRSSLRHRAKSLKEPRRPALRSQLGDELHMRFWSLENKSSSQDISDAGIIDIRAQIAGGRLSTIPQGDEVFPNASDGEDVTAQRPERPCKAAQDAAQLSSEPEAPSTPIKRESLPNSSATHSQHRSRESCQGRSRGSDRDGQKFFRKPRLCDLSGNWLPVLAATAIVMVITAASLYSAKLPMPRPPEVASPQSAPTLAPDPAPALTSLLCEACMASCGALALQGANPYLTGENVSMQALQLQEGLRMTCSSGYCVPPERPELLSMCAAGTSRVLVRQDGQSALAPAAQAGRRLLVAGSQRQLTHVGREQMRLLNRWTRAMAHRVALETDSPTATTAPVTLAAAEAPFADPFLMEFEDSEALQKAYTDMPMTFEQALMTARLEAKMATQGNTGQDAVRNVALNNEQPQMLNLLDMDNAGNVDSDSALGPPALIRRTPSANYDETPGEPLRPSRGGVSRSAGIKPQSAAERQVLSDLGVRVMGVVEPDIKPQQGKCYMLAYNQGYANLSSVHYLAVKNTANKGACCNLCLRDSRCVAWTRVAGGRSDVRTCYLKDSLQRDPDMTAFAYSYAPPYLHKNWPQVRYIVETMPVMLESGTKTLSLPSELYGCPYPVNPALPPGTCAAPDLCNCYTGICFGTCKGGMPDELR